MKMAINSLVFTAALTIGSAPVTADDKAVIDAMTALTTRITKLESTLAARSSIPQGAVVAFVGECPSKELGWEPYTVGTGKFILGAGDRKGLLQYNGPHIPEGKKIGDRIELTLVQPGDQGGEEGHILTIPEMPQHRHSVYRHAAQPCLESQRDPSVSIDCSGKITTAGAGSGDPTFKVLDEWRTGDTGGSGPHNNMPPYIALNFCRKTN